MLILNLFHHLYLYILPQHFWGRCREQASEWVVMVRLYYTTTAVYNYAVVALMVFQVVIVAWGTTAHIHITHRGKQLLQHTILYDCTTTIIHRILQQQTGCIYRAPLFTIGCIMVGLCCTVIKEH